ncbi:hypothetical protein BH10BAC3_BH10BAC3_31240 [soil metagenome]
MIMKKILLTVLLTCIGSIALLYSQDRSDRIEALKIAFITKQLQLSSQEAEKFWPVYNGYEAEMKSMVRDHRQKNGSEIELEEKILGMHKKYKPVFLKVISEDKFDKLMAAERTWGEMLRKELQRRQQGGGKQRPGLND